MPLNTHGVGLHTLQSCWEIVEKQDCSHCGPFRCELHQHLKSWMPKELEYCVIKQKFGSAAEEGANTTCVRAKSSQGKRCERHPDTTNTIGKYDTQM